ncbi:MAG: hypothetical protein ACREMM_00140 [Gemmatimonadales bacterium]
MSKLLDAATGIPNACEPIPGIVTGGQPTTEQLAALKRAGCEVILDIREPMEPRPYRPRDTVVAAGLEYISIPVSHGPLADETFDRVRQTVRALAGTKRVFFHCASGSRVGVTLIPYLMLDLGLSEEAAVTEALRVGMRNAGLLQEALEYVRRVQA